MATGDKKPVAMASELVAHTNDKGNPHVVTAAQTGAYSRGETDTLLADKASLATQQTVEKINVTTRSVTVSASDLPAYLKALPRLITEQLTIHTSGTVTERLDLTGFYGSGRINITADTLGNCTVTDLVNAKDCSVPVMFSKLAFVDSGKADATYYHAVVCGENMKNLTMDTCTFTGDGTGKAFISVGGHGRLYNCTITGFAAAVSSFTYAIVGIDGATASDNSIGAHVYWGGIMILCAGTPKLLGGASNQNSGGIISHNGVIV